MEQIKIGWAKREISTDKPVSIPGQMHIRVSEGILDPLYVTALAVEGGEEGKSVIFLSCDIVTLHHIDEVNARAQELDPSIPPYALIMNATHTHSSVALTKTPEKGPDGQEIYSGEKYAEFFIEQCAAAAVEAWQNRKKGGIAFGYGYAAVANSRRVCYFEDMGQIRPNLIAPNGHAIMYGKTNDPLFSHYEAGADHFLNALFTLDEAGKLTGIVVNVPCPSQLSEGFTVLSADYWNEVRAGVKKEFGEDVFVLPQCAAAGDLTPRQMHYKEAQSRRLSMKYPEHPFEAEKCATDHRHSTNRVLAARQDIADRILDGLTDIWSWAKKEVFTEVPVDHELKTVDLQKRFITDEEAEECRARLAHLEDILENGSEAEKAKAQKVANSVRWRNKNLLNLKNIQEKEPTLPMRMHVVRIGDVAFATSRFELYQDFMHRLQARSPFIQTFFIQLAGENGPNYLATKRAAANKGYSASMYCNRVSADGGQQLVEEALKSMNEMKAKDGE